MIKYLLGKYVHHEPKFYKINYHLAKIYFVVDLIRCLQNKKLSNKQKKNIVKYHFSNRQYNILATMPRSGSQYAILALSLAYDFQNGGVGNYELNKKDIWVTDSDVSRDRNWLIFDEKFDYCEPKIWHTHLRYCRIPFFRNKNCRYVVFVRDIFKEQESLFYVYNQRMNTDVKGHFALGRLSNAVNFLNGYGYLHEKFSDRVIFVKYEELISNPLQQLKRIVKAFNLNLKEEYLRRAIPLCTKEEMAKRIPANYRKYNRRVTLEKRAYPFDTEAHNYILRFISSKLKYSFGYEYEK